LIKGPDLFEFNNFVEGYHQLMIELCDLTVEAIDLIIAENDETKSLYITGGFSKNDLFIRLLASSYPHMKVYTSEVSNATALGAALVMIESLGSGDKPLLDLGLNECVVSK
jgi:sugar (pentulose or hexulose) kinase